MFKKLESFSDRLLNRFVPKADASASCPCGAYPYTGPCWYTLSCGGGRHKDCLCQNSAASITCSNCH